MSIKIAVLEELGFNPFIFFHVLLNIFMLLYRIINLTTIYSANEEPNRQGNPNAVTVNADPAQVVPQDARLGGGGGAGGGGAAALGGNPNAVTVNAGPTQVVPQDGGRWWRRGAAALPPPPSPRGAGLNPPPSRNPFDR